MAARSHYYDAIMHISLPVTAKQGLETFWESDKTRFLGGAIRKNAAICTPYALDNTFVH